MSKAYYYCKNFTFKEVNTLFCYGLRDPSVLTSKQRTIRLFRATLRKILALRIHTVHKFDFDRYAEDSRKVREDFDKIFNSKN